MHIGRVQEVIYKVSLSVTRSMCTIIWYFLGRVARKLVFKSVGSKTSQIRNNLHLIHIGKLHFSQPFLLLKMIHPTSYT